MKKNLQLPNNNNIMLSNLCGPLDENLKQISAALEIEINRRGSKFILNGDKKNIDFGCELIKSFYSKSTKSINPEDIQLSLVQLNKINTSNRIVACKEFKN